MAHLIDKSALVAEIERRIESCVKQREDMLNVQCYTLADDASARMGELNCIHDFINTIEVKDVNVDLDFQRFAKEMDFVFALPSSETENTEEEPLKWEYAIAKHFFALGLKAQKLGKEDIAKQ